MSRVEFCFPGRTRLLLHVVVGCLGMIAAHGCGTANSPEQMQAMAKLQELGGRINVKRGGYEVDLTKTQVGDQDLEVLKHIRKLKILDLQGTLVGDAGLQHLYSIGSLEGVNLKRSLVTPDGAAALQKALPSAQVAY